MQKILLAILFLAACAPLAFAQNDDGRSAEFFIGYSNLQAETGFDSDDPEDDFFGEITDNRTGLHGVNASITGYVNGRFGFTGDFSYHTKSSSDAFSIPPDACTQTPCPPIPGKINIRTNVFNFLAGPQYKFANSSRVEPFVRALAGVAHTRTRVRTDGSGSVFDTDFSDNSTDFALALGGGLDVRLSERVALRAFQVDYNPVFLRSRDVDVFGFGNTERFEGRRLDNVRFSVGIVFR